jgi:hypothetical protein
MEFLVYRSRACHAFTVGELERLSRSAREHNSAVEVTGMLVYAQGRFIQHFEGAAADVEEVFDRIRADPRHTDIRVLERGPQRVRRFPTWSMGFDAPRPDSVEAWLSDCFEPAVRPPVVDDEVSHALLGVYAPAG